MPGTSSHPRPPCGKEWSKAFARQQIVEQAGKRFDPNVVKDFESILTAEDMIELAASATTAREAARAARSDARPPHCFARFTMSSHGARLYFLSALMLISVIPFLAFFYIAMCGFLGNQINWNTLIPLAVNVALLMVLGYSILAKYPASVVRLRH